jgi:23S rRNA (guanine745-N1)-methyltransferase
MTPWPLACPVCGEALAERSSALECPSRHCFDVAREGYVNLLPAQHRSRGIDGDVPSMLQARRRFLDAGHYAPLLGRLTSDVEELLGARSASDSANAHPACVLEVGCGEGYYVGNIAKAIGTAAGEQTRFLGTDLSKSAVKLAARKFPTCTFFVADVHRRVYVQDSTVGVLLDIFAPRNPAEFARIIEPGGWAVIVIPSPSHLSSARAELGLLGIEEDKEERILERFGEAFQLADRAELTFDVELSAESASDLVSMGPSHWHRTDGGGALAEPLSTAASLVILRLKRR